MLWGKKEERKIQIQKRKKEGGSYIQYFELWVQVTGGITGNYAVRLEP